MDNPSITIPSWMNDAIEERKHPGIPKSYYIREAIQARFNAEDAGGWDDPEIENPNEVVADGGE